MTQPNHFKRDKNFRTIQRTIDYYNRNIYFCELLRDEVKAEKYCKALNDYVTKMMSE